MTKMTEYYRYWKNKSRGLVCPCPRAIYINMTIISFFFSKVCQAKPILTHLSRRLTGDFLVYPCSGVRHPSSIHIFKQLLLRNRFANQSQILYGASLGRENESVVRGIQVTWPRWPPRPYMVKTLQKSSSPEPADRFPLNLVCSIGDSSPS